MQYPLFEPQSDWAPPELSELPDFRSAPRIALDTETRDPTLKKLGSGVGLRQGHYVVGYTIAVEGGPSLYLPLRHAGGGNMEEGPVLRYLRDMAAGFRGQVVGANLPYDINAAASDGVMWSSETKWMDVQIADPLIWELHDSYSLEAIAQRHGLAGKDESLLTEAAHVYGVDAHGAKAGLWELHSRFVGPYGEQDGSLPLQIMRMQEKELAEQHLEGVWELESKLLPVLAKMRRRGVRVDLDRLERIEKWARVEAEGPLSIIATGSGRRFTFADCWNSKACAAVLRAVGMDVQVTYDGNGRPHDNVDKSVLAVDNPVAQALARARKLSKLTQFADSVREHLADDGRIHCQYSQVRRQREDDELGGAAFGRLGCEKPNLQQQPSRDDFAMMWRAIYLPEPGELWGAGDYSQQEPRMAVHYACLSRPLIGQVAWDSAIVARDKYRSDPKTDNHQMMADMAHIKRKAAKEIYLGLSYGMGGAKLCSRLGLPTMWAVRGPDRRNVDVRTPVGRQLVERGGHQFLAAGPEGQELLDAFDAKVPFIKAMARACEKMVQKRGYIMTLSGRRCHFPKAPGTGAYDWAHKGFNRLIQGSAADQTKIAMVALAEAGFDLILQVHDEIALSLGSEAEGARAQEIQQNCCPLELPSKVDMEIGKSWGHSMGLGEDQ